MATCGCECHPDEAPDVTDPVAAVLACDACRHSHCPALLPRVIWGPQVVQRPAEPPPSDGDGPETD